MSKARSAVSSTGWDSENGKFVNLTIYLVSYALLWYGFSSYVAPVWGYYGFSFQPNTSKIIESLVLLIIIVVLLPSKPSKPSDFLLHIHALLPVLPMLVLYGASNYDSLYTYCMVASFLMLILCRNIPLIIPIGRKVHVKKMLQASIIISALTIVVMLALGGYKYLNFNLFKVYEFRRSAAANLPSIFGYISPIVIEVIIPFSLILSVYQRENKMTLLSLTLGLIMFGLTSHKTAFFYPIFVVILYFFCEKGRILTYLLLGYLLVMVVSLLGYYLNPEWDEMANLFIRRSILQPASANYGYHQFFSEHPHTLLSNSKFSFGLIKPVYPGAPAFMIGEYMTGNPDTSANTGWLGTSFMHFGYYGMFIFSLVIGLLLGLLDKLAYKTGKSLSTALVVIPFFSLFMSADLPTALMTHGLILALFLLWMLKINPRKKLYRRARVGIR